jgi:hypothetical protein
MRNTRITVNMKANEQNLKTSLSRWKRAPRGGPKESNKQKNALTTQGGALGAPRTRPDVEDEDLLMQPMKKKAMVPVPTLEQCLGVENLQELREEEEMRLQQSKPHDDNQAHSVQGENTHEGEAEQEATSPLTAGKLTGAKERTCQEP